ncbi:MAG: cation:proton antiporter, partial [Methanolobus sp.]|nr:cation:proton antiporter [Methanolobus sp.]
AFFGGVALSDLPLAKIESIQKKVNGITYAVFTPLFFAFTGFSIELAFVGISGIFTALVILVALSSKLIGGFVGTKMIGFDNEDSLIFGVGMMPRSGVELVIITIGRELGTISEGTFSAIVLMVVTSIIVSPVLLERTILYKERKKNNSGGSATCDPGQ